MCYRGQGVIRAPGSCLMWEGSPALAGRPPRTAAHPSPVAALQQAAGQCRNSRETLQPVRDPHLCSCPLQQAPAEERDPPAYLPYSLLRWAACWPRCAVYGESISKTSQATVVNRSSGGAARPFTITCRYTGPVLPECSYFPVGYAALYVKRPLQAPQLPRPSLVRNTRVHVQDLLMLIDVRAAATPYEEEPNTRAPARGRLRSCCPASAACGKAGQSTVPATDQLQTSTHSNTPCRSTCIGVRVLPALGRQLLPTCAEPLAVEGEDMANGVAAGVVLATLG
jgi:hypothetical protein